MTIDWNEIEEKKNRLLIYTLSRPIQKFGLESCKFIILNADGVACAREKTFLNLIISVRSSQVVVCLPIISHSRKTFRITAVDHAWVISVGVDYCAYLRST